MSSRFGWAEARLTSVAIRLLVRDEKEAWEKEEESNSLGSVAYSEILPSLGLPSLKTFWPQKLSQVTMTTIQQLHLGSPNRSTVADECWLEHCRQKRAPPMKHAHWEAFGLQRKQSLPQY